VRGADRPGADRPGPGGAGPEEPGPEEPTPGPDGDGDGDGVPDASDNCWQLANPSQKDGDGDGLGNGCDEGAAPFLTPDEDEVAEAWRAVVEPSLEAGPAAAEAAEEAAVATGPEPTPTRDPGGVESSGGVAAVPEPPTDAEEAVPAAPVQGTAEEADGDGSAPGDDGADSPDERTRGGREGDTEDGGDYEGAARSSRSGEAERGPRGGRAD
jgi:hypothetical protein